MSLELAHFLCAFILPIKNDYRRYAISVCQHVMKGHNSIG